MTLTSPFFYKGRGVSAAERETRKVYRNWCTDCGAPAQRVSGALDYRLMTRCPVCGSLVGVTGDYYEGTLTAPAFPPQVLPHQCWDILAMIERGDFS